MGNRDFVIIGANEFQYKLILKAKEKGYRTHVFAWQTDDIGEHTADVFYPISITEKERILEQCLKIKPAGVASIASDLAVVTVNYVAEKLGLPGNGTENTECCTNKYKMRACFRKHGIKTPPFFCVSDPSELEGIQLDYPVIVKPTDRSGSRGITKVMNPEELTAAIQKSAEYSFEKKAIIEGFLEGSEYSAEFISYNNEHRCLAITKKFTTGAPHFIETGHMESAPLSDEVYKKIVTVLSGALDALNIKFGAAHAEFRIDSEGEINIIEIGARMGGDCIGSDLVQISTGYDFLGMVIDVACGRKPSFAQVCRPNTAFIQFIFTNADIAVLDKIKSENPSAIYEISDIGPVGKHRVVDSSSRFGYYILACESPTQGCRLLNKSPQELTI